MNVQAPTIKDDLKADLLDRLRARYDELGFTFTAHPEPSLLPDFFEGRRPDALAQKGGLNDVIEVRRSPGPSTESSLADLRRLLDERPGWRLRVFFTGSDPLDLVNVPTPDPAAVHARMGELRALIAQGHLRAAFIMSWSLLEAALRSVDGDTKNRARRLGTVVQALAMNGLIDPEREQALRGLINLRNRIVHGDLTAEPSTADVEIVLKAIEETISADAT